MTLAEVHEATELIQQATDAEDANIIFGIVQDLKLQDEVRITVLATGFDQRASGGSSARASSAATGSAPRTGSAPGPAAPGRAGGTATTEAPREQAAPARTPQESDVDIPAFLRRR